MSDEAKLLVRIEASAARLEAAMNKAAGIVKTKMDGIDKRVSQSNKAVTDGLGRSAAAMMQSTKMGRSTSFAIQNAAFQFQDFAVQVASGTSASRAFAQQAPQLLSAFGLFGVLAGTAAAALIPLAGGLLDAGYEAGDATKAVDQFGQALGRYQQYLGIASLSTDELTERFGKFAEVVKEGAQFAAGLELANTMEKAQAAVEPLKVETAVITERLTALLALQERFAALNLQEGSSEYEAGQKTIAGMKAQLDAAAAALGITTEQAMALSDAINRVGSGELNEIPGQIAAAIDVMQTLKDEAGQLPAPLREAGTALADMQIKAGELRPDVLAAQQAMWDFVAGADGAAGALDGATAKAEGLAGAAQRAAAAIWSAVSGVAAQQKANQYIKDSKLIGQYQLYGDSRTAGARSPASTMDQYFNPPSTGGGGGGGGAKVSDEMREAEKWIEATRTELEKYNIEKAELNDLMKAGLLDEEIHARGLQLLAERYPEVTGMVGGLAEAMNSVRETTKSAFADIITGSSSVKEALASILDRIAQVAAEQAAIGLFGDEKSGGLLGGLFDNLLGGIFGGARAKGGPVSGNKAYLVGEKGPELFAPGRSGSIVPNNRMHSSGGQSSMRIELGEGLVGTILEEAHRGSVQLVQSNNKTMPERVLQFSRDKRKR